MCLIISVFQTIPGLPDMKFHTFDDVEKETLTILSIFLKFRVYTFHWAMWEEFAKLCTANSTWDLWTLTWKILLGKKRSWKTHSTMQTFSVARYVCVQLDILLKYRRMSEEGRGRGIEKRWVVGGACLTKVHERYPQSCAQQNQLKISEHWHGKSC